MTNLDWRSSPGDQLAHPPVADVAQMKACLSTQVDRGGHVVALIETSSIKVVQKNRFYAIG